MDASSWKSALAKYFGVSARGKWLQLAVDVECVALGLKPAYLLDTVRPDGTKLCSLLEEVLSSSERKLWLKELIVLLVDSDVLLVNWRSLQNVFNRASDTDSKRLNSDHETMSRVYVDITRSRTHTDGTRSEHASERHISLESGTTLASEIEGECQMWFSSVLAAVQSLPNSEERQLPCLTTALDPRLNVCTLFGKALGYPVVYWFEPVEGYSLDMVELTNYRVTVSSVGQRRVGNVKVWEN